MYARQDNVSICLQAATLSSYGISVQGRVGPMDRISGGLNRGWTKIWTKRQSHGWSKELDLELWLEQDFDPGLTPWLEPGRVVACVPHPLHNRTQGRSVSFNPRSFILQQHTGDIRKPGGGGGQQFSLPTTDHLFIKH